MRHCFLFRVVFRLVVIVIFFFTIFFFTTINSFIAYSQQHTSQNNGIYDSAPQKVPPTVVQKHKQLLEQIQIDGTYALEGVASYYADKFHGKKTANGEIFDMHQLTAAHKSLPFNTIVLVTNLTNKKQVRVRINDRGPYLKKRIIDLSMAAAKHIDMIQSGTAPVHVHIVKLGDGRYASEMHTQQEKVHQYNYLQVASFKQKNSAKTLVSQLTQKGLQARIETFGQFHRVLVKNEKKNHDMVVSTLASMGFVDLLFVKK